MHRSCPSIYEQLGAGLRADVFSAASMQIRKSNEAANIYQAMNAQHQFHNLALMRNYLAPRPKPEPLYVFPIPPIPAGKTWSMLKRAK